MKMRCGWLIPSHLPLVFVMGCSVFQPAVDVSLVPRIVLSDDHLESDGSRAKSPMAHKQAVLAHREDAKVQAERASFYRSMVNNCAGRTPRPPHIHRARGSCTNEYEALFRARSADAINEEALARAHEMRIAEGKP
jgi:hypothetical protein